MTNGYEERHAYDDAGNEIYRKSYDGTETSYEYNADGRVQYEKTLTRTALSWKSFTSTDITKTVP